MNRYENCLKTLFMQSWKGRRVKHVDDGMLGFVVNVKDGLLRICWDDDSVDLHTPEQLSVL